MSGKVHLVVPDAHSHPEHNNNRADYIGKLIMDIKPDVVVNLGDMFDMGSMASYDQGKKSFHGRSFRKDIEAGLDFDERIWAPIRKAKKRMPRAVFLEGNHEYRLKRLLDIQPELEGTVSFDDFGLKQNYDDIVEYVGNTPGSIEIDGINYAHYFVSGVMGRPIGGEHPAYSLITKEFVSSTCGHIHTADYAIRTAANGRKLHGLVAGVYQDYDSPWAGEVNKLWYRGLCVKRNVEDGNYDPQFISLDWLQKEYS